MRSQPAVVIIARHAARLDQADKEWQSKSDRPWDSPLSYGGWIQSQTLGARIATELQAFAQAEAVEEPATDASQPRKKRKIIIHSSPFLRCVQTSIGIAAGIKHPQEYARTRQGQAHFPRSSLSKPPLTAEDSLSPTTSGNDTATLHPDDAAVNEHTDLRLDAFLGEWLSSGYYERSTPPPPSQDLVKGAKDTLKLAPEEIKGADLARASIHELSELDWDDQDQEIAVLPPLEMTGLRAMAVLGHSLPKRSRTLSFGKDVTAGADGRNHRRVRSSTYSPPVPTYAIAPQDSIPPGFVAHARDACIRTDYAWDSEQSPLEWGDGGQYEEEWVTMHRRFRNGLQQMLAFYDMQSVQSEADQDGEEDDADLVLILVTHQAGCNALIRLVTGAPALHDVGLASLTMATRKTDDLSRKTSDSSAASHSRPRRGSLDLGLAEEFDMRIIASTEHLRPGSNPLGLNSPRLGHSPAFASRRVVGAESLEGFSIGDPLSRRSNSVHPLGRSSSLRSHAADSSPMMGPVSGTGLWGVKTRNNSLGGESVDPKSGPATPKTGTILEDDETPDSSPNGLNASPISNGSSMKEPSTPAPVSLPVRSASQKVAASTGLWGSGGNDIAGANGLWSAPRAPRSSFGEHLNNDGRRPGQRRWTAGGQR